MWDYRRVSNDSTCQSAAQTLPSAGDIDAFATCNLLLAATPIGNVADASTRLRAALQQADIIAAEDTRRAKALVARLKLQVSGRYIPLHEHNEEEQSRKLLRAIAGGTKAVMISDAGMPAVSDPGFRLAQAAAAADIAFTVLPGPSAVVTALAISGLPSDSFAFWGFLPRKAGELAAVAKDLQSTRGTTIFFESPRRLLASLKVLAEHLPGRPAAICRELTKTHEEVRRATLAELYAEFAARPEILGEIVLLISPPATQDTDVHALQAAQQQVADLQAAGLPRGRACALVSQWTKIPRNLLY